jgi:hypothetical protein
VGAQFHLSRLTPIYTIYSLRSTTSSLGVRHTGRPNGRTVESTACNLINKPKYLSGNYRPNQYPSPTVIHPAPPLREHPRNATRNPIAGDVSLETKTTDIELEYDRGLTWRRTAATYNIFQSCPLFLASEGHPGSSIFASARRSAKPRDWLLLPPAAITTFASK